MMQIPNRLYIMKEQDLASIAKKIALTNCPSDLFGFL